MVRNYLIPQIIECDTSYDGQVWLRLQCLPNVLFAGCYVPPSDSPYFSAGCVANIQAKCLENNDKQLIVMGDLNSRVAKEIALIDANLSYDNNPDLVLRPNPNGTALIQLCKDTKLIPLNGLTRRQVSYERKLTYRQRQRGWISELDWCLVSLSVLDCNMISNFHIDQNPVLPSNHAPLCIQVEVKGKTCQVSNKNLLKRACELGTFEEEQKRKLSVPRINSDILDANRFQSSLPAELPPVSDVETMMCVFSDALCTGIAQSMKCINNWNNGDNGESDRWKNLLQCGNSRDIWQAINWKGQVDMSNHNANSVKPTDAEFKAHFQELLQSENIDPSVSLQVHDAPYIPVLDEDITVQEVQMVIHEQLKGNKGPGPDGLSPYLYKCMPLNWLWYLTQIINCVFHTVYPESWRLSRLITIYKKGDRLDCDSYRGISIMNCNAKIYDYVLSNRLQRWFQPDREQAGGQRGRSCMDHVVTLRLLFNYARETKQKLFVLYVDFSKAFDRIPRTKLLQSLMNSGCGKEMLSAIASMYQTSWSAIGEMRAEATAGVRQGAPSSIFFFTFYVNDLIRRLKALGEDGYLKWLHSFMLMDDTVILATSKEKLEQKLNILNTFCQSHGFQINQSKTKFMVIGGSGRDREPIISGRVTIANCDEYHYLGVPFTQDGRMTTSLKTNAKERQKQLLKLAQFLHTNRDYPLKIKRTVLEAAFDASLLYGCESWMDVNTTCMNTIYMKAIKLVLGVRESTPNAICLLEMGVPSLYARIQERQYDFFKKVLRNRNNEEEDPLMFAINLNRERTTKLYQLISRLQNSNTSFIAADIEQRKQDMRNSTKSKDQAYYSMNPDLSVHTFYNCENSIPEYQRIAFTRIRCVSHNLAIERGRWARVPREERLCLCGSVQTEEHVLIHCNLVNNLRTTFSITETNANDIFKNPNVAEFIQKMLIFFEE